MLAPWPTGTTAPLPYSLKPVTRRHRLFSRTVTTEWGVMECRCKWYRRIYSFLTGQ